VNPFAGFDLEEAIRERARGCGLDPAPEQIAALATHARLVLAHNARFHLTTITEPAAFVERHVGESLEGAALLPAEASGPLVDVGSGNGYPGLALACTRPGLEPLLVEAAGKKAEFLRGALEATGFDRRCVLERQVQRPADLEPALAAAAGEAFRPVTVMTARALGNWERMLPRLAGLLARDGTLLLWAGPVVPEVAARKPWQRFRLTGRHPIPGRDRSWIWIFDRTPDLEP
jgi:16S rRNA (guanine527-N7)-methyltransferase